MSYEAFLASKLLDVVPCGIEDPTEINPALFGFQRDIVRWALRRGRAALFADCGLGKTPMQLEWALHVAAETDRPVLILAPLAVAAQTVLEGQKFGIPVQQVSVMAEVDAGPGVYVTNYEKLRHFVASAFGGVVLDESSILKAYDGKTRTEIIEAFHSTPFRLACTATPAPNDYMELGNHAEFLGAMSRSEMLSMFFVHDGGETQKWRLKGHAEADFWAWVCSWAVMLRRPSDLGYEDDGFILPDLEMVPNVVGPDDVQIANTLTERRQARKDSLEERVQQCADLVNATADTGEPWLIWCGLNAEGDALEAAIPGSVQVAGSDSPALKEERMLGFAAGRYRVLITKPKIAGFGMNWQHCARMAFVGLSDSYEQLYQAIRRCWRFGQTQTVRCHVITSRAEGAVVANIQRKEADAVRMAEAMVHHMADINAADLRATERTSAIYTRDSRTGQRWILEQGDCIDVLRETPDDAIGYSIFSPPFASLYTYSNSERDLGNTKSHAEFYEHFRFLIPELLRVTQPGRLLSFHCMLLPTSKAHHGVIGLFDFRGELIRMFVEAGWIFHSEVTIWKNPVTAMQRTKALGLLHKQLKKDSCMSRQGIPDYLVTMRKPGDNPERVSHTGESFPVSIWQRYASPVWMDINPSDTLQFRSAREDQDERHICPLQLSVIERGIELWSRPGDLVLDPFAGIGSTGHVALQRGRFFIGVELKGSYFEVAAKHLEAAEALPVDAGDVGEAHPELISEDGRMSPEEMSALSADRVWRLG